MRVRALLCAALALSLGTLASPPPAAAHTYPSEITVEAGKSVKFHVKDPGTCKAKVHAWVPNPDALISVSPDIVTAVDAVFTVTAGKVIGDDYVFIEWIGIDALTGSDGPCQEISGEIPILVHVVASPKEESSASRPASGRSGDPVDTFTGELVLDEAPDLDMGGPLPLRFTRYYASKLRINFVVGDLGDNWRHGFDWRIHSAGTLATLVTSRGKVLKFLEEGSAWNLQTATDHPVRLARDGTDWVCIDPSDDLVRRFEGSGRMTRIEDGRGNGLDLEYAGDGRLLSVVEDAPGSTQRGLFFDHDGTDRITTVTESWGGTPGRSVAFDYDGDDLVAFTDAAGGVTVYAYDPDHADPALMTTRTSPRGNVPWTQTFDDVGKVATQADAFGNAWVFDFGNPYKPGTTKMTRPDGGEEVHVHDAAGFLLSTENDLGDRVALGDDDGAPRRASIEDPSGARTLSVFDADSGLTTSETDALGNVTTFAWQERTSPVPGAPYRDLLRIDHPDGTAETFTYDASGNRTSRTDGEGNTWTFTFDGRGNALTGTDPLGGLTTHVYDGWGNRVFTTDPAGKVTTYFHDGYRRVSTILLPDGTTRTFTRDALDRLLEETDGEGRSRIRTYDANGNLTSQTDFDGVTTNFSWDAMDRVVGVEDALGGDSSSTYDVMGRLASITDRRGSTTTRVHDGADRLIALVDAAGGEWTTEYDGAGRPVASTAPGGGTLLMTRDGAGRVARLVLPSGRTQWSGFDARGRLVLSVDGAGRTVRRTHDGRGLLAQVVLGGGAASGTYGRDGAGRVVSVTDGPGSTWTVGRDLRGLASSRSDPLGRTTTITFDGMGRPVRHDFPGGLGSLDIAMDGAGRVVQRAFSDGTTLDFERDGEGRWLSATGADFALDARGAVVSSNGMGVTRDAEGRMTAVTLSPGKTVTYQYDAVGRLTRVQDWAGGRADFTRDADGRVTGISRTNGVATAFTRDADGNVTGIAEGTLAATTLMRDGSGRVASATRTGPLVPGLGAGEEADAVLDAAHQRADWTWDALGRPTSDGVRDYDWDLASRLRSYVQDAVSVDCTYDAFGLLLTRDDGTTSTEWTWNHAYGIPAPCIRTVDGGSPEFFVHAPDGTLLWSVSPAGARRWYHFDEAGNTTLLTDDAGAVTDAYAFDPWGALQASTGSTDNPFTFGGGNGTMREGDSGLFRMRSRLYDPATRRFLTREPRTDRLEPGDLAPYAYAAGDPLTFVDPTGETPTPPAPSPTPGDAAAKVNAGVGVFAEVEERLYDATNVLRRTGAQEAFKNRAKSAGGASSYIGTGIEIYNANERMTTAIDGNHRRNEAIWDWAARQMEEANSLLRQKRMTREQVDAFRKVVFDARDAQLKASEDQLWTDTLQTSTIMVLNSITGLIPGTGLCPALDWSNPNGIGGALGVVE